MIQAKDVPAGEIERVRKFVALARSDKNYIPDAASCAPHMVDLKYGDFLRLIAWWGLVREQMEARKVASQRTQRVAEPAGGEVDKA